MWPSLLSSHKPHVCGCVSRFLPQPCFPRLLLVCSTAPQPEELAPQYWEEHQCPVLCRDRAQLRDCCWFTDSAWPGHPSPAFSQGSQLLSAAMHLTGKHTERQTGLKGKQKTEPFVLILFYCVSPLASLALRSQPSWAGRGSWDWATGKEPGFIRFTSPPEVAE